MKVTAIELGLGHPVNPFDGNFSPDQYDDFEATAQILPFLYPNGQEVEKGVECEVDNGHIYKHFDTGEWLITETPVTDERVGYEVKACYIALSPPVVKGQSNCINNQQAPLTSGYFVPLK